MVGGSRVLALGGVFHQVVDGHAATAGQPATVVGFARLVVANAGMTVGSEVARTIILK